MRGDQEPTIAPTPGDPVRDHVVTHPAFGMIGASRVSSGGSGQNLFGSDFGHHAYVEIRIRHAELNRNLSTDWVFGRNEIVRVMLSEAQWATFVSSLNVGDGVPCTLDAIGGEVVPGIRSLPARRKEFATEMEATVGSAVKELDAIVAAMTDAEIPPRKKEELLSHLRMARRHLLSNVPFVAKVFDEHMEKTVERAKVEVNAYLQLTLMRAGVARLQEEARLELSSGDEDKG
jgi:hypothetical protein